MRILITFAYCLAAGCSSTAIADIRVRITGAAPVVPALFIESTPHAVEQLGNRRDSHGSRSPQSDLGSLDLDDGQPSDTDRRMAFSWTTPLMERTVSQTDRTAFLTADFREAILRIEGMYDPTRLDGTGQIPRMAIFAGTASMNNVFGDHWSIADTDRNVHYIVRYIADAWRERNISACGAFGKRRITYGVVALSPLSTSDCVRLKTLAPHRNDLLTRLPIVAAVLDVPAFAAPAPGARLSSPDFWAAQEARIASIKEGLRLARLRESQLGSELENGVRRERTGPFRASQP